ncbi:MAG: hypothetical protein JNK47_18715 [Mesorhizobium sp.]|nr:hypothetical protein [Mesorhizobium sp.]MBL8579247.1 hypothetical protein [Mesorhizobium sp.]
MMQLIGGTVVSDDILKEHAALPWRMSGDGTLEVLLLRPRRDGSWRIPAARCSGTRTGICRLALKCKNAAVLSGLGT